MVGIFGNQKQAKRALGMGLEGGGQCSYLEKKMSNMAEPNWAKLSGFVKKLFEKVEK